MKNTPFRDAAEKISKNKDFQDMAHGSERARSHGWWRNLVEYGAWNGPGSNRVAPPDPQAIPGIAKLFGTTEEQVRTWVAADWYHVHPNTEISARVQRLAPLLDVLTDDDADLVENLARRLNPDFLERFTRGLEAEQR